jgi:protein-arginine kinase activator protein McsA
MDVSECEICKTDKPNDMVFLLIGKDNKTTIKVCVDCLKSLINSYEEEELERELKAKAILGRDT